MTDDAYHDTIKGLIREKVAAGETIMSAVRYLQETTADKATHDLIFEMAIAVAAEGKATPPTKEIRFTPSAERYARWSAAADEMGIPLTAWVQIMADGWTVSRTGRTPAVPVQDATEVGLIRDRIKRYVRGEKFSPRLIPQMAEQWGISARKIQMSLQSAVNSKRATFDGQAYQFVTEN
jgi:hypothetical protein